MTPIDFGRGMIFPNRYDRPQDDGPDPCDECEGEGWVWADDTADEAVECPACSGAGEVG